LNWLVGVGGDVQGKTFHVGNRTATIGRGLGNFVQTTDDDASRVHAQFMPVPGGLQIKDMDSSNGTFVNEQKIAVYLLRDGDEIRIGKARFQFRARAEFSVNHGLERKIAGAKVAEQTRQASMSPAIQTILRDALDSAQGNIELAAKGMGIKPNDFKDMLKRYGVEGDPRKPPPPDESAS